MAAKRKLIALMGGMIDKEKSYNFIHETEIECEKNKTILEVMLCFPFNC